MYINFSIFNFFFKKEKFDILFLYHRHLYGKKHVECQCDYYNRYLFKFEFDLQPIKKDHGGLRIELHILGYALNFSIYDSRHWDYKNDCWEDGSAKEMTKNNFDGF